MASGSAQIEAADGDTAAGGRSGAKAPPSSPAALLLPTSLPSSPILTSPRNIAGGSTATALRGALGGSNPVNPASPRGVPTGDLLLLTGDSSSKGSGGGRTGSIHDLRPSKADVKSKGDDVRQAQDADQASACADATTSSAPVTSPSSSSRDSADRRASKEDDRRRQARNLGRAFAYAARTFQHHLLVCMKLLGVMLDRYSDLHKNGQLSNTEPKLKAVSLPSPRLPPSMEVSVDPPGLPWQPLHRTDKMGTGIDDKFLLATAMLNAALRSALGGVQSNQARCTAEFPETNSCLEDELISFDGTLTTVYEGEDAETKNQRSEVPDEASISEEDMADLKSQYLRLRKNLPRLQRQRAEASARVEELEEAHRVLRSELEDLVDEEEESQQQDVEEEPQTLDLAGLRLELDRRSEQGAEVSKASLAQLISHMKSLRQEAEVTRKASQANAVRLEKAEASCESWRQYRRVLVEIAKSGLTGIEKEPADDLAGLVRTLQEQAEKAALAARQRPLLRRPNSRDDRGIMGMDVGVSGAGSCSSTATVPPASSMGRLPSQGVSGAASPGSVQALVATDPGLPAKTESQQRCGSGRGPSASAPPAHVAAPAAARRTAGAPAQGSPPAAAGGGGAASPVEPPQSSDAEAKLMELSARYAEVQRQYQRVVSENCRLREELDCRSFASFGLEAPQPGGSSLRDVKPGGGGSTPVARSPSSASARRCATPEAPPFRCAAPGDADHQVPKVLVVSGEGRGSPLRRGATTPPIPEGSRGVAVASQPAGPCHLPAWPGIPTWPAQASSTTTGTARGAPSSPGPMRRLTAQTAPLSSPPGRARPSSRRQGAEEGARVTPVSSTQHQHQARITPQVAAPRQQQQQQQQQQRRRAGAAGSSTGAGPSPRSVTPQPPDTRQPSSRLPLAAVSSKAAAYSGDSQVPIDGVSTVRSRQDSSDQQPAPKPMPESGLPSPPVGTAAPGSGHSSARSPRPGVPTTPMALAQGTVGGSSSSRCRSVGCGGEATAVAAVASAATAGTAVSQLSFAAAASAALGGSMPMRLVAVPKSWDDQLLEQQQRALLTQQRLPAQLQTDAAAGPSSSHSCGCSWGPGPPSRQSSPDGTFEPDCVSVSPVRRTLHTPAASAASASARGAWSPAPGAGPLSPVSPARSAMGTSPLSSVAVQQPASSLGRRVPPRQVVCAAGPSSSAAVPSPLGSMVRGKVQTSSTRSLGAPPQRPPSPVPQLMRSASAHSMAHSPEPRSRSPGPGGLSPCRPTTPVVLSQPGPGPCSPLPQEIAQATILAAAAAAQAGRGSRTTWPTPAMHAQLARAGAMGGLSRDAQAQAISRSGVASRGP